MSSWPTWRSLCAITFSANLDSPLYASGDHHCPRFTADKLTVYDLFVEMIHHDLGLKPYRVPMALDVIPQLLLGPLRVVLRIVPHRGVDAVGLRSRMTT